ncbi:MAG TPA: hypothetical protein VFG73_07690 [Rhodanobacteraceae bacterium]|nr:hypothetical protein [Rhodanobacteraceae bacterium]
MDEKICVFEDVYNETSARAQAEKEKSQAFGMLARVKVWDRPKDADIALHSTEKRYEPFWNVKAVRRTTFSKGVTYHVPAANPHAQTVDLCGQSFALDSRRELVLSAMEQCRRQVAVSEFHDGLQRESGDKNATRQLSEYASKYAYGDLDRGDKPQYIMPTVTASYVLQQVKAHLMTPIDADEINEDLLEVESMTLLYRPVYAFDYLWRDKHGVLEIDGLTGRVNREGDLLGGMVKKLGSREALFDVGGEIANAIVPGGAVVLRLVDRMSTKGASG